jgi:multiple sugar transport system substrate-binding protein
VVAKLDVVRVLEELKTPEPDFDSVVQGLYTGQLSNPKQQMRATKERYERALEHAIKAARAKGAKVSRDDWTFSNWEPTKNYTADDYRALNR